MCCSMLMLMKCWLMLFVVFSCHLIEVLYYVVVMLDTFLSVFQANVSGSRVGPR